MQLFNFYTITVINIFFTRFLTILARFLLNKIIIHNKIIVIRRAITLKRVKLPEYKNILRKEGSSMKNISNDNLIDIFEVKTIFNLSIEAIRKYKALGFIKPCKRVGRKDFYNKQYIIRRKGLIETYKKDGKSLQQIEDKFNELNEMVKDERDINSIKIAKKILIIYEDDNLFNYIKKHLNDHFSEGDLKTFSTTDIILGIECAELVEPDLIVLGHELHIDIKEKFQTEIEQSSSISHTKLINLSQPNLESKEVFTDSVPMNYLYIIIKNL